MQTLQTEIIDFIFRELAQRDDKAWLGARRRDLGKGGASTEIIEQLRQWGLWLDPKTISRLAGVNNLLDLLESYLLKGVRLDSHMGLWGLVSGRYPLILRRDIPSPREMLELQCEGHRYVSFLLEDRPQGRFNNRYEFLMHDLEHAHKFFGDADLFHAQVQFFTRLREALPYFREWSADPDFVKDLNYLMSDMNSHPVHLLKYLKAIVLTADLRRGKDGRLDDFWREIFAQWKAPLEFLRINQPGIERPADQILVHEFFKSAKSAGCPEKPNSCSPALFTAESFPVPPGSTAT